MTGRLFRFTPHGGKPNHYTDSFRSALAQMEDPAPAEYLQRLAIGASLTTTEGTWERVA